MLRTNTKLHQLLSKLKLLISWSHLYFTNVRTEPTEMVETKCLKAEVLRVSQKVRTVLVRYLLSGIRILVYPCTGCGTSKIYLCPKITGHQNLEFKIWN